MRSIPVFLGFQLLAVEPVLAIDIWVLQQIENGQAQICIILDQSRFKAAMENVPLAAVFPALINAIGAVNLQPAPLLTCHAQTRRRKILDLVELSKTEK